MVTIRLQWKSWICSRAILTGTAPVIEKKEVVAQEEAPARTNTPVKNNTVVKNKESVKSNDSIKNVESSKPVVKENRSQNQLQNLLKQVRLLVVVKLQ